MASSTRSNDEGAAEPKVEVEIAKFRIPIATDYKYSQLIMRAALHVKGCHS